MDRRLGYEQALDDAGIKVRKAWIVTSRPIQDPDASEKLIAIFRAKDRPTAAVCMDDALAIGLTGLLKGMGLDVPGDVSIVSFNNTDAGKYHIPALTSFEIDPYRLGMSAMHLMADVLKGTVDAPRSIEVPFTLIERDSVGARPQANKERLESMRTIQFGPSITCPGWSIAMRCPTARVPAPQDRQGRVFARGRAGYQQLRHARLFQRRGRV